MPIRPPAVPFKARIRYLLSSSCFRSAAFSVLLPSLSRKWFSASASWTVRVTPSNVPTNAPAEAPVCSACTCGYSICTFLIFTVARFVVPRESVPGVTAPIKAPALAFVRTTGWQISRFLTLISCVTVPNSPPVPSTAVIELAAVFPTCRPSIRYVFP